MTAGPRASVPGIEKSTQADGPSLGERAGHGSRCVGAAMALSGRTGVARLLQEGMPCSSSSAHVRLHRFRIRSWIIRDCGGVRWSSQRRSGSS